MCILFIYNGAKVESSDYKLILISNRDEYFTRPASNIGPWEDDPEIIGGKDLVANGTWLAISVTRKKIGVLLNLPRPSKQNALSRGKVVTDFVKDNASIEEFIKQLRQYADKCNNFVVVGVDFSEKPTVHSYSNETDKLTEHTDTTMGFGNSLPSVPLKKVCAGTTVLEEICTKHSSVKTKQEMIEELLQLLKSEERHLPDPELELHRPEAQEPLSAIFVSHPSGYGTRTHTIILVTKDGHVDVIEETLQSPIDINNPDWHRTELHYELDML